MLDDKPATTRFVPDWSPVQLAADLEYYWVRDWKRAVKCYEKSPTDFYCAYEFLRLHPANIRRFPSDGLGGTPEPWFEENLRIFITKVDPITKRIETKKNPGWRHNNKGRHPVDNKRNTETAIWLEWGPWAEPGEFDTSDMVPKEGISSHDPRTDTGARTFEKAIVRLAHNVYHLYGAARRVPDDKKLPKKLRK